MTEARARQLKVGDAVRFVRDQAVGEVVEVGYCALKVRWDDGCFGIWWFDQSERLKELELLPN